MANIGDTIRYLNSTGGGVVRRIEGQMAYVEEPDGFETPVLLRECVVVLARDDERAAQSVQKPQPKGKAQPVPVTAPPAPTEDTAPAPKREGTLSSPLNLTLAYEPRDIKKLSTTTFDAYLINDSEYALFATYMTRGNKDTGWVTRYASLVEPGMQEWMGEFGTADLNDMERICVQYIAFLPAGQGEFALKSPVMVESRLEAVKFCKLHCFRDSVYFDTPVLEIELVRDDVPRRQVIFEPIVAKIEVKDNQKSRPVTRREAAPKKQGPKPKEGPLVVDLHINELIDSTAGLSHSDMLNMQIDHFRSVMDQNLKRHGQKIIFIHGKGEGVLRGALLKELRHRYKGHDVQDASFLEYGYGATQVTIR